MWSPSFGLVTTDVRDTYGAVANAKTPLGAWNTNPTDASKAFQRAADAGGFCYFPDGDYFLDVPDNCKALIRITQRVEWVFGPNARIYVRGSIDPAKWSDVILIESLTAQQILLDGISIEPFAGVAQAARAYIVLHAAFSQVNARQLVGAGKWGVIVESGYAQNMEAATLLANGQYINTDFWAVEGYAGRGVLSRCGNIPTAPYNQGWVDGGGAGIYAHGSDSAGRVTHMYATYCNAGYHDATLAGAMFVECYGEFNWIYGKFESAAGSIIIGGKTEDLFPPIYAVAGATSYGGDVIGPNHFGYGAKFVAIHTSGNTSFWWGTPDADHGYSMRLGKGLPGVDQFWTYSLVNNRWGWVFNETTPLPGYDAAAAIQLTEGDARGPGLVAFGRPTLNSAKRWKWRQASVTITANSSVLVKTSADWATRLVFLATDPTLYDPNNGLQGAQTIVHAQVEIHTTQPDPTVTLTSQAAGTLIANNGTTLSNSALTIGATMPLAQDKTGGVWGALVNNAGNADVVVDVLWTVELVQYSTGVNTVP